ncbi:putative hexose transporter [Diaporthe ampelina]|uniref:Putative hexose transporter n=1 Tax=Diaporthe ampelina TaxID=1214573 RepID=A0A0G2HN65_9PEZI|nr:putative hexose transporter [Diaporthe ampelina]
MSSEKGEESKGKEALTREPSVGHGELGVVDDQEVSDFYGGSVSDTYRLKFQWYLFVVNGFGWVVDNFWSQGITAVRPPVANEFTDITYLSFSSVAYYVGLIIGASFWGVTADLIGRKPAFNATILIGGIFACAVAGSQNFVTFCSLWAVIGTAAGGNVPVDSIIFLERYVMITLGALAIAFALIRIFVFKMPESPRYLLSRGRDAEAVEAVNYVARYNGKPETLTLDMLKAIDEVQSGPSTQVVQSEDVTAEEKKAPLSYRQIITENFKDYSSHSYRKLFAGRKMARHSSVIFLIWLTIGVAYPLYFAFITSYLQTKTTYSVTNTLNHTYMVYCIVSIVGVIGPIAAGFSVETRLGRRWMMALSAILTGVFLFAYTSVGTEAADIGFQCATAVLGNFEYAIMFAFTPESFPAPVRGTGTDDQDKEFSPDLP